MALAIIALCLFTSSFTVHIQQFYRYPKQMFFIPFVIGALFQVIGYIGRIISIQQDTALGPYIVQVLFLLLAPILYAASVYGILEKIIDYVNAHHLVPIKAKNITKIFVTSDVVCFFVQSIGGSM